MTWVKLSDTFYDDPDVDALSLEAVAAFALMLSWCGRHETDGAIPEHRARLLARKKPKLVDALLERRFLERNGDGLVVRNWLKYQPSKAELDARRRAAVNRKRRERRAADA